MFTAEIRFQFRNGQDAGARDGAVDLLLDSLRQNGQILGREFPCASVGTCIRAFVMLPATDALAAIHHNKYVKKALAALADAGLKQPTVRVMDEEGSGPVEDGPDSYILFTNYLAIESPLRSGATFAPTPLYKVPPTYDESEYYNITSWQSDYQACDTLWMNSAVGEQFARRQLSNVSSDLSNQGRELCAQITTLTGLPTYYYLYRQLQRTSWLKETLRKCPGCGGEWLLPEQWHIFDFQCDGCRLVSNISWGTFKPPS